jgi:selenocysteine lyase/cysteine desulfurase
MITSLLNREDYPSLGTGVYLNQASLGLIGQPAVTAMQVFIEEVARHGNANMSDQEELACLEALRNRAAKILNTRKSLLALTAGASEILSQLPFLIQPQPSETILVVGSDFPAITRPWHRLAALKGCHVRLVHDNPGQDLTESLISALDESVAAIAVGCVQYATGTVVNITRLLDAASQVGARLIIDATQAAGAIPVDANAWSADALVCSGYKWLGGHGGVALAVMSPRLLEQMPPLCGWMGAPDPFDFDAASVRLADNSRLYTQSTMSYASVTGLTIALDQLLELGRDRITEHARALAGILIDGVARHGWQPFRSLEDPGASPHIISLAHAGSDTQAAINALRKHNIVCGTRGDRLRVSIAPYNDESDVRAFIGAIAEVTDQ